MISYVTAARVARNTGWSFVAQLLSRIAQVLLFLLLSRMAGANAAGVFTIGITYLTIAGRIASWGLDQILIRDIAQEPQQTGLYVSNFLLLRTLLAVCVLFLSLLFLRWGPYPQPVANLIFIVILNVLPEGILTLCQALFTAYESMEPVAILGALVGVLKIVLGWWMLYIGYGIDGVAWTFLLSNILVMIVAVLWVAKRYSIRWCAPNWQFCWQQMRVSAPFVLIAGAYILDNQADTLVLSWLFSPAEVGIYGAASTMIVGLGLLPQAFRDAILPAMSRAYRTDMNVLRTLYQQSMKYMLVLAFPISAGLAILAQPILKFLFGNQFIPATGALQILSIALCLQFILILHNRLLVVANQQRLLSFILFWGVVANVVVNSTLSPYIGINGAAIGRVVSALLVFGLTYWRIFRSVYTMQIGTLWMRPLLSALMMVLALWFMNEWNLWARIISGTLIYGCSVMLLGVFSFREVSSWRAIIR